MLQLARRLARSWSEQRRRKQERRRQNFLRARPGFDDCQLEERIVPATHRFLWAGTTSTSPVNVLNWRDLDVQVGGVYGPALNLPGANDYCQYDGYSGGNNCVLTAAGLTTGDVALADSNSPNGAFAGTLEIPAGDVLQLNGSDNYADYLGTFDRSLFRAGTIQLDGAVTGKNGGIIYGTATNTNAVNNSLFFDGGLVFGGVTTTGVTITEDVATRTPGSIVIGGYVTHNPGNVQTPTFLYMGGAGVGGAGSNETPGQGGPANVYLGYNPDLSTPNKASALLSGFASGTGWNLSNKAIVKISSAGKLEFGESIISLTPTGGIFTTDSAAGCELYNYGTVTVDNGQTSLNPHPVTVPFYNEGHVTLSAGAALKAADSSGIGTFGYFQHGFGTTEIGVSSDLVCGSGANYAFYQDGGTTGTDTATDGTYALCYLDGDVYVTGGLIGAGYYGASGKYADLYSHNGNWSVTGGSTLWFAADGASSAYGHLDKITTNGNITIGSATGTQPTMRISFSSVPIDGWSAYFVASLGGTVSVPGGASSLTWTITSLGTDTYTYVSDATGLGLTFTRH